MNINLYQFKGDPQELLAGWQRAAAGFDASDYVLNLVSVGDDGITVVDVCPTEADFQGWINGDDWRAALSGRPGGRRAGHAAARAQPLAPSKARPRQHPDRDALRVGRVLLAAQGRAFGVDARR